MVAVLPMLIVCLFVILGVNSHAFLVPVLIMCSWCPFANAALSLAIIRPYREFVGRLGRPPLASRTQASSSITDKTDAMG